MKGYQTTINKYTSFFEMSLDISIFTTMEEMPIRVRITLFFSMTAR